MGTKTNLALILAGALAFFGGTKSSIHYERKGDELEKSLPAKVHEIDEELYDRELVKEQDSYDPNVIAKVLEDRRRCQSYQTRHGLIGGGGPLLTGLGLGSILASYLKNTGKRKSNAQSD